MRRPEDIKKLLYDKYDSTGSMVTTIEYGKSLYPEYIKAPNKPKLEYPHTSQQALDYSSSLKQYEEDVEVYNSNQSFRDAQIHMINDQIVALIKDDSGLYDIPKQYQDKVYAYAYEDKHSDGMYQVYLTLTELVAIFK